MGKSGSSFRDQRRRYGRGFGGRERYTRRAPSGYDQRRPMPINGMCNPLCPFFRCSKNAKILVKKVVRGHTINEVRCRWIGDKCIGWRCQFGYCERHALLPDGRCAFAVKFRESTDDFFKEIESEDVEERVESKLTRRYGGRRDRDLFD